ncbi:hypothetical protein ONO86_04358 [Micromonospora noduli]|nr:hypothetical protein ONO86_04358 [Micromonospora noduli]
MRQLMGKLSKEVRMLRYSLATVSNHQSRNAANTRYNGKNKLK